MSFNLMTLGGIAACIGVVIDDAIVIVENITVHLSMGQSPDASGAQRHRGIDPGADRLHADADRGLRAARVPGRHHGGLLPRPGPDAGDRAAGVALSGHLLHAGAGAAVPAERRDR